MRERCWEGGQRQRVGLSFFQMEYWSYLRNSAEVVSDQNAHQSVRAGFSICRGFIQTEAKRQRQGAVTKRSDPKAGCMDDIQRAGKGISRMHIHRPLRYSQALEMGHDTVSQSHWLLGSVSHVMQ